MEDTLVRIALEFLASLTHLQALVLGTTVCLLGFIVHHEIKYRALGGIPGPLLSRYTNAWRCYLAWKYSERPGGLSYHEYLHSKYNSKTVRVGPKTVFTNDPAAIHVVLSFKDRLAQTDNIKAFLIPGQPPVLVGIADEQEHSNRRRAIDRVYSLSSLKAYEPLIDETIQALTDVLTEKSLKGEIVNIALWCRYCECYASNQACTYGESKHQALIQLF